MAKRPRMDTEVCDYCYYERLQKGRRAAEKQDLSGIRCVCSPETTCKSVDCVYGSSIGGKGGHTAGTRKKHYQSST